MSDGAHHFWEKRPKFSIETLKNPIRFASSLQRRINKNTSIDDYSLIAVTFQQMLTRSTHNEIGQSKHCNGKAS